MRKNTTESRFSLEFSNVPETQQAASRDFGSHYQFRTGPFGQSRRVQAPLSVVIVIRSTMVVLVVDGLHVLSELFKV